MYITDKKTKNLLLFLNFEQIGPSIKEVASLPFSSESQETI
ncbi:hypothetical protein CUZ89_2625 [Enterococcus xinjiangensis]|nr:hypothetical protein [Enterococcus lactis]